MAITTYVISENTTRNYAGVEDLQISARNGFMGNSRLRASSWELGPPFFDARASLIRFTGMSSLPAGGTVVAVRLRLYQTNWIDWGAGGNQSSLNIAPSLRNWNASQAEWPIFSTGNNWAVAGGHTDASDYDVANNVVISTPASNAQDNTYVTYDISAMADAFDEIYKGTRANNGIILSRLPYGTFSEEQEWMQSEGTDGQRPILEIDIETGGGGDVTVTLGGVSASTVVGTLRANNSKALLGNNSASAVGTIRVNNSKLITGVAATTGVGIVRYNISKAVVGNQASGFIGNVNVAIGNDITVALTGVSTTGFVGAVTSTRTRVLTGVNTSGNVGTIRSNINRAVAGVSAVGAIGDIRYTFSKQLVGQNSTGAVGILTFDNPNNLTILLTGVGATSNVGAVGVARSRAIGGVVATGRVGVITYVVQGPNWQIVNDGQVTTWVAVNDTQTTSWTNINTTQ